MPFVTVIIAKASYFSRHSTAAIPIFIRMKLWS